MDPIEDALSKTLDHTIYLAKKSFKTDSIGLKEPQKLCVDPLLIRSCHKAHAINILVKERLIEEAETILRILVEISFVICAICKEEEFALKYGRSAWAQKMRELSDLTEGIKRMKSSPVSPEQVAHMEAQLVAVRAKVKQLNAQKLLAKDYAEKADLLAIYYTTYAKLSSSVHSGPEDLERFFDMDQKTKILKIGRPKEGRVDVLLWTAVETMLRILKASSALFGITIPELEGVERIYANMTAKLMSERKSS